MMFALRLCAAVLVSLGLTASVMAQDWEALDEDQVAEITGSITTDFYHEMGHALIHVMDLPVLGNEEDAADLLSVFMINELWQEEPAQQIMSASLATWATMAETAMEEIDFWDEHAPSAKRLATMACLFYGANPEARVDFADEQGIPEERREDCAVEWELVYESWGVYFDELIEAGPGETMVFVEPEEETPVTEAIRDEVEYFNSILTLPMDLVVSVEPCGMANAYFSPDDVAVVMCTELADQVLERM